ncbi:hypothetical protein ACQ4LE_002286 [Meloidogyne hapla]
MSSPTSSHYPNPQQTFPKPKYSLNLRPEDCSNNSIPPLPSPALQKQQQNNPTSPSTARCRTAAQIIQRQQGSTDSAPTTAGISSMKRKEIWARVGPSSFHQSFDIRSDPISNFSTSCGHIDDAAGGGICCACKGYRTERRSGFCSGDSSRDSRSQPGHAALTLYCGVSGCSGHPSCPGVSVNQNHHHHLNNNNLRTGRSTHSSFDEGDHSGNVGSVGGPLRDTYLTEISREWMLMNGAIAPFKHILQQASSITSTPLPNHRPFQSIATPAAAASAVNTASAIMAAGSRIVGATPVGTNIQKNNDDNEIIIASGGSGLINNFGGQTLKNSCFNLTMSEQNNNNIIGTPLTAKSDNFDQQKQIIIIEPDKKLEGDPLLKKSLSLIFNDGDIESQRPGAVSAIGGFGGGGHSAPPCPPTNSERGGGPGSVLDESINCSVKQPLVKEKERGGRFIKRQQLFNKRRVTSDYALFFVLFGIVLMIIENEFAYLNHFMICTALKTVILISTIILVGLVVKYHVHEIQLFMNANSAEDWQIALTCRKSMQIIIEVVACAICPLPVQLDGNIWPTIPKRMPLDVLFSILMFFRLYWLCRVMLLHSRLFTDAASRSIAGLNRVKTDAKFILKTLMTICPGTVLMLFTASLWMIGGYILRLCERHNSIEDPTLSFHAEKHQSYLNSLWLVAVTFLSIGYGDIVPNTQCGRIMAVVTGILGTCTSSMVVAVIARKLELTRAEKHVHNFMIETQHTKEMKHIAANVLRETWLIYKNRRLVDKIEPSRIRYHQRKFLVAICALRKLKTSQRKLEENRVSLGDVAKTTAHSHDLMRDVHTTQEGMALRITAVEHQLSDIQRELSNLSELLRFALRPQIEYSCSPTQQFQHYDQNQQEHPSSMITLSTTQMASGQQNIVETRQRRKPSALSEPIT